MTTFRGADHPRRTTQTWNAKCSKCGDQTVVPWDPKADPKRVIMCRNCRNVYL